jgi:hypothetical protein
MLLGLAFGLALGLTFGLVVGLSFGLVDGLAVGLVGGLAVWLVLGLVSTAWGQWLVLARFWLPLSGRLPWPLMDFLDDA